MLEKNKILNFLHLKNVTLVKDQDQNQAIMQVNVLCVVVMGKLDRGKDFLLFSKHVDNVLGQAKKIQIHAVAEVEKVSKKQQKEIK